jgi:hypothetical protein
VSTTTIIGLCLIAFATTALTVLVLWSRHIINRIDRSGPRSARMILQDLAAEQTAEPVAASDPSETPDVE